MWQTDLKFGTVGAVALDRHGNLAAATSTGGMTNKQYGRVGDSPIIGAGTYADNATVAVSGTGAGEFFIRGTVAYDIAALMKYQKQTVSEAVDGTIKTALDAKNGRGGVVALDDKGNLKFGFNTEGMYRGYIKADGKSVVHPGYRRTDAGAPTRTGTPPRHSATLRRPGAESRSVSRVGNFHPTSRAAPSLGRGVPTTDWQSLVAGLDVRHRRQSAASSNLATSGSSPRSSRPSRSSRCPSTDAES